MFHVTKNIHRNKTGSNAEIFVGMFLTLQVIFSKTTFDFFDFFFSQSLNRVIKYELDTETMR